jgi:hypothetical protein
MNERDAQHWAALAAGQTRIRRRGGLERALGGESDEGIQARRQSVDTLQEVSRQFDTGKLTST